MSAACYPTGGQRRASRQQSVPTGPPPQTAEGLTRGRAGPASVRSHGATAGRATGTAHHRGTCPGPVRRTPARAMPPLHCAPATAPRLRERFIAFQPVPLRRPAEDRSASTARSRTRSAATDATRRMRPTHPPPNGEPDTRAAADGGLLSLRLRCSFLRVWACAEGPPTAAARGPDSGVSVRSLALHCAAARDLAGSPAADGFRSASVRYRKPPETGREQF